MFFLCWRCILITNEKEKKKNKRERRERKPSGKLNKTEIDLKLVDPWLFVEAFACCSVNN